MVLISPLRHGLNHQQLHLTLLHKLNRLQQTNIQTNKKKIQFISDFRGAQNALPSWYIHDICVPSEINFFILFFPFFGLSFISKF